MFGAFPAEMPLSRGHRQVFRQTENRQTGISSLPASLFLRRFQGDTIRPARAQAAAVFGEAR